MKCSKVVLGELGLGPDLLLWSAELRVQRVALAQAMQEKRAAKIAAKKEQMEKAKAARAATMAAKAAARAAEIEAAARHGDYAQLTSDDDFLNPVGRRLQRPSQPGQSTVHQTGNGAGPSRSLNGFAQHAQHAQGASDDTDGVDAKQPASRNGYHLHHAHQHNGQLAALERHHLEGDERQIWSVDGEPAQLRNVGSGTIQRGLGRAASAMLGEVRVQPRGVAGGAAYGGDGTQPSLELHSIHACSSHRQQHPVESASHLSHDQPGKAESSWHVHAQLTHSAEGEARQLPQQLPASESESRRPDSEEADDKFDWGAWMSPEGERKAIAERLQRPRRPPKRPYPSPDPPKPRLKKHHSSKGNQTAARHQHRLTDRLLRQESGSTSSGQFSQEWPHGPMQHAHRPRSGFANPGRSAASHRAGKGRSKGRRALAEVGCIRAAPYQGEAFMQARMDVQQQQGVVPGNQAPADADHGHQVCILLLPPSPTPPWPLALGPQQQTDSMASSC